jgi:hypothetical protein
MHIHPHFGEPWPFPAESAAFLKRFSAIFAALLAFALFGGTLLPLLGHGIVLFLEVLELACDRLLEAVFGLEPRTAQIVTAWGALTLFLLGSAYCVKRVIAAFAALKAKLFAEHGPAEPVLALLVRLNPDRNDHLR